MEQNGGRQPWISTTVEGEGCDLFWPCIDHPQGKPKLIDLHISVPSPLVVAGNGVALGMEEKDGWPHLRLARKKSSTYGVALNIGPYEMLSGDYDSRYGNKIPLRMWYLKGHDKQANGLFAEFAPMLDFFEAASAPTLSATRKWAWLNAAPGHGTPDHQRLRQRLHQVAAGLRLAAAPRAVARMVRQPDDQRRLG